MISIEKVNTDNEKHNMVSIVKVNTMNTEAGVYRVRHRRRNVQGQIITQEKECTGADNFSGMNVQGPTITQEKECMVTIITLEKECIGTDHCTGKPEQLTRTFAVLVLLKVIQRPKITNVLKGQVM